MELEEQVKTLGFSDILEFNRMVASVNMTTPANRHRLRLWQEQDGTKDGLERIIRLNELLTRPENVTSKMLKQAFRDGLAYAATYLRGQAEALENKAKDELAAANKSLRYQRIMLKVNLLRQEANQIESLHLPE